MFRLDQNTKNEHFCDIFDEIAISRQIGRIFSYSVNSSDILKSCLTISMCDFSLDFIEKTFVSKEDKMLLDRLFR